MKDLKLSFPYPKTSRHNLSQDVALSLSMGLVIPARIIEVLAGDSHRIGTSFSLISNPLIKPLLQGVKMRYTRFWVPRRIYHIDLRANNSDYDPVTAPVRTMKIDGLYFPLIGTTGQQYSNFQQSSLFDYLGYADAANNFVFRASTESFPATRVALTIPGQLAYLNAEPYLAYVDICRNYFADSATGLVAWSCRVKDTSVTAGNLGIGVCISPLEQLDAYMDGIQNGRGVVSPYNFNGTTYKPITPSSFTPFLRSTGVYSPTASTLTPDTSAFNPQSTGFGLAHVGFCVPMNRPDRMSRLFDLRPLTSQSASVSSNEVTIANLSFLSKLQRYLTRKFFGGSRYTDIMYNIFGQRVPHVDSPVLLDVFDYEIGSELVASTNATDTQNPGVLGGYLSSAGRLTTSRGRYRRRYSFNEAGYIVDLVYILPRLFRSSFVSDYIFTAGDDGAIGGLRPMQQGNFIPDLNGIGWQQPSFVNSFRSVYLSDNQTSARMGDPLAFCSEASWQQYRTLPDICRGLFNPSRSIVSDSAFGVSPNSLEINSPLFTFNDRMNGFTVYRGNGFLTTDEGDMSVRFLSQFYYSDPNDLNRVFGTDRLTFDNIFCVFRYSHQAKRQVSKRFTLTFA